MYPPVAPDELTRHAREVGRILLEAGLAPAGKPRRWLWLACSGTTRIRARIKKQCYSHFRFLGLLLQGIVCEGLFDYLLYSAWVLASGYGHQDLDELYWGDLSHPFAYCLGYALAEATLAEFIGLDQLEELVELLS